MRTLYVAFTKRDMLTTDTTTRRCNDILLSNGGSICFTMKLHWRMGNVSWHISTFKGYNNIKRRSGRAFDKYDNHLLCVYQHFFLRSISNSCYSYKAWGLCGIWKGWHCITILNTSPLRFKRNTIVWNNMHLLYKRWRAYAAQNSTPVAIYQRLLVYCCVYNHVNKIILKVIFSLGNRPLQDISGSMVLWWFPRLKKTYLKIMTGYFMPLLHYIASLCFDSVIHESFYSWCRWYRLPALFAFIELWCNRWPCTSNNWSEL